MVTDHHPNTFLGKPSNSIERAGRSACKGLTSQQTPKCWHEANTGGGEESTERLLDMGTGYQTPVVMDQSAFGRT